METGSGIFFAVILILIIFGEFKLTITTTDNIKTLRFEEVKP